MEEEFIPPESEQSSEEQEGQISSQEAKIVNEENEKLKPYFVKVLTIKNIEILKDTANVFIDADGEEYIINVPLIFIVDNKKFDDFIKFLKEVDIPTKRYQREKLKDIQDKIQNLIGKTF